MKQERVILLILLVASAIVLGTTCAIVTMVPDLVSRQETTLQAEPHSSLSPQESESASAPEDVKPAGIYGESSPAGENYKAALTPVEKSEIQRMLKELGHQQPTLSQSIRSFQTQNNIKTSGVLDGTTLDSIIQQTTLLRSQAFRRQVAPP